MYVQVLAQKKPCLHKLFLNPYCAQLASYQHTEEEEEEALYSTAETFKAYLQMSSFFPA